MAQDTPEREWWKEAVVYQIYPRSFNDADGDGVGDIPGVIEKVEYLDELGVDVVWLCPVYDSPNADNGYDIRDYRAIMDEMGTMDDWERLLEEVHSRDMRLIMDMVLNHTSDEHEWFLKSKERDSEYSDYYYWRDGEHGGNPNNWTSIFGGDAWKYDEVREQYYLHIFDEKQPDLNWRNEDVRQDVYEMLDWWLRKGIDGFRLDVINLISKTEGLPDGEPNPGWTGWEHVINGPRVHEYIREMYDEVLSNYDIMTVAEMPGCGVADAQQYCGEDGDGLNMIVHFEHADIPYAPGGKWDLDDVDIHPADLPEVAEPDDHFNHWDLNELRDVLTRWQVGLEGEGWNANYLGNHDHPRTVSRFGDDGEYREKSAKMLATLQFTLKGTPFIYQGEEIGMTNVEWNDFDELRDVEAIQQSEELMERHGVNFEAIRHVVKHRSRDNARTPMQWSDADNAGFTDGDPWIKVNPNHESINVAEAREAEDSIWAYYQDLIDLREAEDTLVYGEYHLLYEDHPDIYAYVRADDDDRILVVLNCFGADMTFHLPDHLDGSDAELLLTNNEDPDSVSTDLDELDLPPYEARVYRL
ncbi:alpha,alpha-phosphotrehalase [Halapricum sp. CBA1109]|uniref:glycoside hydrolase family 13 protein n=1 Tax=Halapricum sp. CBA1109 TaxID=2668068 RepID=UPI0012F7C41E|nr:alpha-glucosidase [Halapricum sp. CBA1109]MUV89211.1 alpha,alpha-phosphotrehalase [Halapricum sp. CBA1109]